MTMPVISAVGRQRLKFLFSFLLGMVLMALLFTAACLQASTCSGSQCNSPEARLRRIPSLLVGDAVGSVATTETSAQSSSNSIASHLLTRPTEQQSKPSKLISQLLTQPTAAETTEQRLKTLKTQHQLKTLAPTQSTSTYTIPTLNFVRRTFPVPPDQTHSSFMAERTSKHGCNKTHYCREYLSSTEDTQFAACYKKCDENRRKFGPVVDGDCHFMNGRGRLPVVLASFPGSGNTWARGLLEKVTGICTGGLYCDCGLRTGGFTGEGVQGPSVLVMKTHNLKVQFVGGHFFSSTRIPFGAAILLVRDPRAALVAEWNREKSKRMVSQNVSNHFTYVEQSYFGANKEWNAYIHFKLSRWPQQTVNLLIEAKVAGRPVHILKFESLKADTAREMKKVTDFLGFSYTEEDVTERLQSGFSKFYRNHTAEFSHFTAGQEQYIHSVVYSTSQFMNDKGVYNMFPGIDDYL